MTIKRAKAAADRRGFYLNGREWINNVVGYGYYFYGPFGKLHMSDTIQGIYNMIMEYPPCR